MLYWLRAHLIEFETRKEALRVVQEKLKVSRERYYGLYDMAPVGFIHVSEKGLILDSNPTAATMLGVARDALFNQPITRFILTEDHGIYFHDCEQLAGTDTVQACELRMVSQDGISFRARLDILALKGSDGSPGYIIALCDITDGKQAEQEDGLRIQNEICFQVLNGLDFIIYVVDMETNEILFINTHGEKLWGDLKGKIYREAIHPDQSGPAEYCTYSDLFGPDGNPADKIVWEYQDNVNQRWYERRDWTIHWPGDRIVRMEIVTDITERKRAEKENANLEARNRQLQKAESLERMAAAIAHNFNNHFQVVMGNLEMARDGLPMGINPIDKLVSAMQAIDKAAELSTLMLTYLGLVSVKPEHIDLSEICRRSLTLLQAAAPKGTILKVDFPSFGPVVRANAGQITQVLVNLVTNAWESAEENRSGIALAIQTVSQTDIPACKRFPANWNPQGSLYACLEVVDAGRGIACKDIENLFDPFFTTKSTGRGMGLSVVLGIVRAHNGGITVESVLGQGSVFRIFLPLSPETIPTQIDKAAHPPERQEGGTILLVEEDERVRNMSKIMLSFLAYKILKAEDGIEAP